MLAMRRRTFLTLATILLTVQGVSQASAQAIYMGDTVEVATMPNGVRMNAQQLLGSIGVQTRSAGEVADGIWSAMGYSVVNVFAIRGNDGLIVIDTGISTKEARAVLEELRKWSKLPVKAIIYTHRHYMAGAAVFAEGHPVTVIGHPADAGGDAGALRGAFPELRPVQYARGFQQMGGLLPETGEDAAAGERAAIPAPADGPAALPLPITMTATDGLELTLSGVRMRLFSAHASDDNSVTIWLPDRRIAFNNFTWPVAANLYAPRGDAFRDARSWIGGIKVVRSLRPTLVLSTHAVPLVGERRIQESLGHYIDYHQILFDQTLRGILKGVGPEDIRDFAQVPASYQDIRRAYGETTSWYPRSIYGEAFGWFSGDAAELNPVSASFRHRELTRLLGGVGSVLELASAAEKKGQFAWALELANHAFKTDPENPAARSMKARLLRKHGELTPASISHNFYMSQARALEGKGPLPSLIFNNDDLRRADPCTLVDQYRIRVVPERTRGLKGILAFRFGDRTCGLAVREGLAEFVADLDAAGSPPVAEISLSRDNLVKLFSAKTSLVRLLSDPGISVNGDRAHATQLADVFEDLPGG